MAKPSPKLSLIFTAEVDPAIQQLARLQASVGKFRDGAIANFQSVTNKSASIFSEVGKFGGSSLNDLSGGFFGRIASNASTMGANLSQSLGIGQTAATALGAAISVGVLGAMTASVFAAQEFTRQLNIAKQDQLAMLGISSETQRLFGVTQKQADSFYESLQVKTELAGRDTSVSAQEIADLNTRGVTAFLTTFKDSGESLEAIGDRMVEINKRFAILSQATPGVTEFQVKNAYTSAITGDLKEAIDRQEFFRNSGFSEVIKEVAKERNINLGKASRQTQVIVLEEALKRRVPQGLIDRAQNDSIEAQMSAFTDKLFAQRTGLFGIQRDLDTTIEGNQSVFTEVSRMVKLVLGKGGLFDQIGQIFGGIDFDAMKALRDGISALNDFIKWLTDILQFFNEWEKNNEIKRKEITSQGGINTDLTPILGTVAENAFIPNGVLAGNIVKGLRGGFDSLFGGLFGNSYTGNIPGQDYLSSDLMSAIATESANKPPNSKLLIANDSEYIFPDQESLQKYTKADNSKSVNFASNSIVINSNGGNPEAIAQQVINQINQLIQFEYDRSF